MRNVRLLLLAFLLLAFGTPVPASIRLQPAFHLDAPDGVPAFRKILFRDLDGDGIVEVINIHTGFSVYSLITGKVIEAFVVPGGSTGALACGLLDGDKRIDMVQIDFETEIIGDSDYVRLVVWLSTKEYQQPDTLKWLAVPDTGHHTIDSLFCADYDHDGIEEVYARYYHMTELCGFPDSYCERWYHYNPIRWENGTPVEKLSTMPANVVDAYPLFSPTELTAVSLRELSVSGWMPGGTYFSDQSVEMTLANRDLVLCSVYLNHDYCRSWNPGSYADITSPLGYCVGDLMPADLGPELVVNLSFYGEGIPAWGDDVCTKHLQELVCFALSDPDTLVELWRWDVTGRGLGPVFADSRTAHTLFTVASTQPLQRRLYAYDTYTGTVTDSSAAFADPGEWVDYRSTSVGGTPYAIFEGPYTLTFFSLDTTAETPDPEEPGLPGTFELSTAYPNPFNAEVNIEVSVSTDSAIDVSIINLLGEHVASLNSGKLEAGTKRLIWNASDRSSGVYLIRASSGGVVQTRKIVLLK